MVIIVWHWNHANLMGPRPLEGFCVVDPPTVIVISMWGHFVHAGKYHTT